MIWLMVTGLVCLAFKCGQWSIVNPIARLPSRPIRSHSLFKVYGHESLPNGTIVMPIYGVVTKSEPCVFCIIFKAENGYVVGSKLTIPLVKASLLQEWYNFTEEEIKHIFNKITRDYYHQPKSNTWKDIIDGAKVAFKTSYNRQLNHEYRFPMTWAGAYVKQ